MALAVESPQSVPAHPGVLAGAIRLLATIEDLAPGATGALRFGRDGLVLVESRLVCWAIAAGMEQRLSELLRHQRNPPIERDVLERVVRECNALGKPLGEALVSTGQVTAEGLRRALFRHTADAIAHIAGSGAACEGFVPHVRARYDARFVFPTAEILASLGSRSHRVIAAAARAQLSNVLVHDAAGLAFVRDGIEREPVVLAVIGCSALRVTELQHVGAWAARQLDLARELDPDTRVATASWGGSSSIVCWRTRDTDLVALCRSRAASARMVAALMELREGPTETER